MAEHPTFRVTERIIMDPKPSRIHGCMVLAGMCPSRTGSSGSHAQTTSVWQGLAGSHELVPGAKGISFTVRPWLIQIVFYVYSVAGCHVLVAGPTRINSTLRPVLIHMCFCT